MSKEIHNLTLFTDASYCPTTTAAGGAYWARGTTIRTSGHFPLYGVKSSLEAELAVACHSIMAISLDEMFAEELIKGRETRLVVVTDCTAVRDILSGAPCRVENPLVTDVLKQVRNLQQSWQFWMKINHVKAHNGTDTPRKWVNDWCDKHAYKQMVAVRNGITGGQS